MVEPWTAIVENTHTYITVNTTDEHDRFDLFPFQVWFTKIHFWYRPPRTNRQRDSGRRGSPATEYA